VVGSVFGGVVVLEEVLSGLVGVCVVVDSVSVVVSIGVVVVAVAIVAVVIGRGGQELSGMHFLFS